MAWFVPLKAQASSRLKQQHGVEWKKIEPPIDDP
jgi:hypothetical protein